MGIALYEGFDIFPQLTYIIKTDYGVFVTVFLKIGI
jgi:hypothetical protein